MKGNEVCVLSRKPIYIQFNQISLAARTIRRRKKNKETDKERRKGSDRASLPLFLLGLFVLTRLKGCGEVFGFDQINILQFFNYGALYMISLNTRVNVWRGDTVIKTKGERKLGKVKVRLMESDLREGLKRWRKEGDRR